MIGPSDDRMAGPVAHLPPAFTAVLLLLLLGCDQAPERNGLLNSSHREDAEAADPATDHGASEQERPGFILTEESSSALVDSLRSGNANTRKRWARSVANTWPRSDGALSEALSSGAFAYPQEHPSEFIALFGSDEQQLSAWADLVSGELIIADVEPFDSMEHYMDGMKELCIGCTAEELALLERFKGLIHAELSEKLR